ncbi:MAG: thiamine diphosphokinase [bacterium]|nr:thiamine diphosphokinase [bacterium]
MKNTTAVIVANAPIRWTTELAAIAEAGDPLVAADGGADSLALLGLRPSCVVGDLDSISEGCRAWLGEELMVPRPDQNFTDLDKTLRFVIDEQGANQTIVIGALGGRFDHEIGNLGLLATRGLGQQLVFRQADSIILGFTGELELDASPGETWSFYSFDPAVRLTVTGVRWPLEDARVDVGFRPSISNLATEERVHLQSKGGASIVCRLTAEKTLV